MAVPALDGCRFQPGPPEALTTNQKGDLIPMSVVSMRELLEAGVHFGHQTRRWNPKMRRFIFTERGGIYIIDLQKTLQLLEEAHEFARNIAERGGSILFVGTKKQSQGAVEEQAKRVNMPYVNHRWLGGLLTNWRTISDRIDRLHELRRLKEEGQLDLLPAKERISMLGELEKLEENLGGVADMKRQPDAIFIVDLRKEQLAVREAKRLNLPVVALVDTNCDPDEADYVIPGNDDAIRSCDLIVRAIADGIAAGQQKATPADFAPAPATNGTASEAAERPRLRPTRPPRRSRLPRRSRRRRSRLPRRAARMAEISAALVKELRDQTGAPMMDCKRALQETNGDMEAAVRVLREKGMAGAAKRSDRETPEGKVGYRLADENKRGTMVAVGCETEPVSNNEEFLAFAEKVLKAVETDGPGAEASLDEERVLLAGKLGENIVVTGTVRFEAVNGGMIAAYAHPPRNKIGVLLQMRGGSDELARKVAMHIAALRPNWIGRDDVPEETIAQEREIYAGSDEVQSKPEQARDKIVEGMLNKRFFGANVLIDQEWIHDSSKKVGDALGEEGAEVLEFERFELSG